MAFKTRRNKKDNAADKAGGKKKICGRRHRRMVKSFITDTRRSICEQAMDKIRFRGINTSKWLSGEGGHKKLKFLKKFYLQNLDMDWLCKVDMKK